MSRVEYRFLPWLRQGAATLIDRSDDLGADAAAIFRSEARLRVSGDTIRVPIQLFGPGEVVGLAPTAIARREPSPGAVGFEPNYFPAIEFRDADLPWRFTPTRSGVKDRLRPWLCLICLEQREGVGVRANPNAPLGVVAAPLVELPELTEASHWAHIQATGPFPPGQAGDPEQLASFLRANPGKAVARLLCPRRLRPNSGYLVCLVPTFEVGRRAGLGEPFDQEALGLTPAWNLQQAGGEVVLPVYDSWRFSTGPIGDPVVEFERLARALQPYSLPPAATTLPFRLDPALTDDSLPNETLGLPGALRPVASTDPPPAPADVRDALQSWINHSADAEDSGGDPLVTPPLYGRWPSGQRRVGVAGSPLWLGELNLDPRHRIAAAAGAELVRSHQDELVAEAWRQAGDLAAANALLRGAQAARGFTGATSKHLQQLPADVLLQVAGPLQARVVHGEATLRRAIAAGGLPTAGFGAAFRRVARTQGPHLRRYNLSLPEDDARVLFSQGYAIIEPPDWQAVDQGTVSRPSRWEHHDNDFGKPITQTSNIHRPGGGAAPIDMLGTMYVARGSHRDIRFFLSIRSDDDDSCGVVFRYRNNVNYYRFSMDRQRSYRRLVKCVDGRFILLWTDDFRFALGRTYALSIQVEGDHIRIGFDRREIVNLRDTSHVAGSVGLYAAGNSNCRFSELSLRVQEGLSRSQLVAPTVVDEGNISGPSRWTTEEGGLLQSSNIWGGSQDRDELPKLGTYAIAGASGWRHYATRLLLVAGDNDAFGLMFRYRGLHDYYRFSMDLQRSYQRLAKRVGGEFRLLWQRDEGFEQGEFQRLEIICDGSRLRGYLNARKLFDLRDRSHPSGAIAFYCWGQAPARFRAVTVRQIHRAGVMARLNGGRLGIPGAGRMDLGELRQSLLAGVTSQRLVGARTLARVSLPPRNGVGDPLEPVRRGPDIPLPLASWLAAEAPQLLLPGVGEIPGDAVVMLETNPAFVAALLVGANHELARELLWRGMDTDLRATALRQFWDLRGGRVAPGDAASQEAGRDIEPIHTWPATLPLSRQAGAQHGDSRTVFLVRSELLRRFPGARYYLAEGRIRNANREPGDRVSLPLFRGELAEDVGFFGFPESPAEVRGDGGAPGWYFVIEQRPAAGRFGLLENGPETLGDWTDLGWNHVQSDSHVRVQELALSPPAGALWGRNSAHMGVITQRRPFRLALHADRLVR